MLKSLKILLLVTAAFLASCGEKAAETSESDNPLYTKGRRWNIQQAKAYYAKWPWLNGANFQPSTAINQLEMWQAETFDPTTIDTELGYAEGIGFNAMRVYLHHLAWEVDHEGFIDRMEQYLDIADSHNIGTIFVFFDDCWNPTYEAETQPEPKTGVHNSGWVRDPGEVEVADSLLHNYVVDVMTHFKDDERIILWDLYNEPGNSGNGNKSLPLLEKVFDWGREVNPSQPLSAGVWNMDLKELNEFQLSHSDITTYHNYMAPEVHQEWIDSLKQYGRPMICTEYMARTRNSTFQNSMPILKAENVGAINWGLVSGKTNTIYAWDTPMPNGDEPAVWFHDIFRKDGTPYSQEEISVIKQLNGIQ